MKNIHWLVLTLVGLSFALTGCSGHDCSLDTDGDKEKFGDIAPATAGAHSCFVSNGELVATHPDMSIDKVAEAYKTKLEAAKYEVKLEEHNGTRSNGKTYEGKRLLLKKDGKKAGVVVYPLSENIVETVTVVLE